MIEAGDTQQEAHVGNSPYPLTVVIPTYNRLDTLTQCLEHLERQRFKQFEVVVVDDGSSASIREWMEAYLLASPLHIRYVRQQNRGPGSARNHAISLARAKICLMIGDDILVSPDLVEQHLNLHTLRPDDRVAGLGLTRWSDTDQDLTPFMEWLDSGGLQFNYGPLLRGETPDWRYFYTSNLSLKTDVLRRFPFDESFPYAAMEDMDLACQLESDGGLEVVFLPGATAKHVHPTTFTQACRRMKSVGESTAYFDRKWPGKRLRRDNVLKRTLQKMSTANPSTLSALVRLADWSLRFICPNYLMRYVLGCHFRLGYLHDAETSGKSQA